MARARKRRPTRRAREVGRTGRARTAQPTAAERHLLRLAQEITGRPLTVALQSLTTAWAPEAPLPHDVARAWLKVRSDKTAALALAWAREQVRLALREIIEATPPPARRRLEAGPDTLAWLLLAACESVAHEPPSAVGDRVRAILELTGHTATG